MRNIFDNCKTRRLTRNLLLLASSWLALDVLAATPSTCSLDDIKNWIEKNRIFAVVAPHYPLKARGLGQKGRAMVTISLDSESRVDSAVLRYSSGHKELDEGIMEMVLKASGLKLGLPMCVAKGERFTFDLPLNYQFGNGNSAPTRELLLELFRTTQVLEAELRKGPWLTRIIFGALKQAQPSASADALEVIGQEVQQAIKKEMSPGGGYLEKLIEVHQTHYTEDDIRALIQFHQTQLGRKVINSELLMQAEMKTYSEIWAQGFVATLSDRINSRFKERNLPYEQPAPKPGMPDREQGQGKNLL